jgi:hypothetical protein
VTRNHHHQTLESLCDAVSHYLNAATPWLPISRPKHRSRRRVSSATSHPRAIYHRRPKISAHSRTAAPKSKSVISSLRTNCFR